MPRFVIRHPDLEEWHISVNDKEKADGYGQVEIFFKPWGIRPDIYYDDILINTFLAEIDVYDHKYEFTYTDDFEQMYQSNIIKSKMDFLGIEESDERFDFYIGLSAHEDIVKKINEKINPS